MLGFDRSLLWIIAPSFLRVITHILGVENLHFSWFWGPRVIPSAIVLGQLKGTLSIEPQKIFEKDFVSKRDSTKRVQIRSFVVFFWLA